MSAEQAPDPLSGHPRINLVGSAPKNCPGNGPATAKTACKNMGKLAAIYDGELKPPSSLPPRQILRAPQLASHTSCSGEICHGCVASAATVQALQGSDPRGRQARAQRDCTGQQRKSPRALTRQRNPDSCLMQQGGLCKSLRPRPRSAVEQCRAARMGAEQPAPRLRP